MDSNNGVRISLNIKASDPVVDSLHGRDPAQFTVRALNVWLASQGASTCGKKAELVERYAVDTISVYANCSMVGCLCCFVELNPTFTMNGYRYVDEISDVPDAAGPSRHSPTASQDDTSATAGGKHFVPVTEEFNTVDKKPKFTMAQILHYFVWRTAVDGLPNADSKSLSDSVMNLSQGGHIQQIMVNNTDNSLEFKGCV